MNCTRCHAPITPQNLPLTTTLYGCERCRGKRTELLGTKKNLGQEDEAHLLEDSKANAG